MNNNRYCVIMAGGAGSRFWPLSRNGYPKQFLDILGIGRTFIQQTYDRFARIIPKENFLVVTGVEYRDIVLAQLPDLVADQVLCEPMRRNTAPCIAYATYRLNEKNPDAQVVVTPADHLITNEKTFLEVVLGSLKFADSNDALVTIGLKPLRPETGYGYIQINNKDRDLCPDSICKVKTFTEKPDFDTALLFMASGEFYWNSGIFIWNQKSITKSLEKYLPDLAGLFEKGKNSFYTPDEDSFIADTYSLCPNISIDYGLMEKASNVYVFRADFGWSDIGTWNSLYHQSDKDKDGNVLKGNIYADKIRNCMINSGKKLVVVKGLDDFLVVDTDDVLMICPRENEDNIKQLILDAVLSKGQEFA